MSRSAISDGGQSMMTAEAVIDEFRAAGALLEGHFVLSSGLHSPRYLQCARVLMEPKRAERLCVALAAKIRAAIAEAIDLVASPAMGGVIIGYEMGRQLGVPAIFFERVEGRLALRRGFTIASGTRCLMVEDVVTTGLSSRECIAAIEAEGGMVAGAASLVDSSGGRTELGVPLIALAHLDIPAYPADQLPADLAAVPAVKPGSRGLR
jgi:orotate phosphoribosyltransferase